MFLCNKFGIEWFCIGITMNTITQKIRYFLFSLLLLLGAPVVAQVNHAPVSNQLKNFYTSLAKLSLSFTFPDGFKEIKAVSTDNFDFDYAMELPGQDFEIWIQVNTQKEDEKLLNDKNIHISNTDSVYVDLAQAQAASFTDDHNYLERSMPPYILDRYGADAGKTYLLSLNDSPVTKHYKYALLIVLQKDHDGTVLAVCFTNEKGPEFFRDMNKASNCLKFKN
jgi:hypothetical protein